jgi:DNA-binding IscR family transcriptional regulator
VEGTLEPAACVNSEPCPQEAVCISLHTWSELYHEITNCVDAITLADLVEAYYAMDKVEYAI